MHYIRLLRPAKLDVSDRRKPLISLLVTITTDLGDSFLYPDEPVDLIVAADDPTGQSLVLGVDRPPRWSAGMRVLDVKVPVKPHLRREHVTCTVKIHPATQPRPLGAMRGTDVLPWSVGLGSTAGQGLIMPATVEMAKGVCAPVSLRRLQLGTGSQLEDLLNIDLEEDIGESIARHIWDAGVVTAAFLADACCSRGVLDVLPIKRKSFGVLELGSGVGILGITAARIVEKAATTQGQTLIEATVLLTDLPEAEERARSNISRAETALSHPDTGDSAVTLQYESLDWDEGKHGQFGPLASARSWDVVVLSDCTYNVDSLPALVGTLSALHAANIKHPETSEGSKTSVILATKPRHSSEQALFGLLEADEWRYRVLKSIPLPKLGDEDEVVDIYLLEKGKG
ncbi:putative methyltransferase-domain-containing protein [Hypoxylon crocopeplum]|nr:putative methyltransferase-domain-containing protein [Hypoxylon crocopeplum]